MQITAAAEDAVASRRGQAVIAPFEGLFHLPSQLICGVCRNDLGLVAAELDLEPALVVSDRPHGPNGQVEAAARRPHPWGMTARWSDPRRLRFPLMGRGRHAGAGKPGVSAAL